VNWDKAGVRHSNKFCLKVNSISLTKSFPSIKRIVITNDFRAEWESSYFCSMRNLKSFSSRGLLGCLAFKSKTLPFRSNKTKEGISLAPSDLTSSELLPIR
jgi:hypothetical protein